MSFMLKNKGLFSAAITALLVLSLGGLVIYKTSRDTSPAELVKAAQPLSHQQHEEIKTKLVQILQENDPTASFDYLRSAMNEDTALARECHPLLHHIGRSAYEKYKDFNKTASYLDGLCNSGYTHGVIEAYFIASNDIQTALKTACVAQDTEITFQQWQCYHGIGHGVMYDTSKDLSQSLSLCESLSTDFARRSCANGVFMERFIIVGHSGSPVSNTSDINISLCKQQADAYKSYCYVYSPTAYLERHINDYMGAFEDCKNAEEKYTATCIYGVGSQAVKENITRPEVARDICQKAPKKYVSFCVGGIVDLLINHNSSTSAVEPLCHSTFIQYKDICAEEIKLWNDRYAS